MGGAVKAGSIYFAGMFVLGFLLGSVRILLLVPLIGKWAATLCELPVILTAAWVYCGWVITRFAVPFNLAARVQMGAIAFTLLITAEMLLSRTMFDRSLSQQMQELATGPGLAGLAAQFVFAIFPLLRLRPHRAG
ncbi:hypothetical protein GVO57_10305 [Sphingomonas changnyeongensis]|uniref:Uncharacterized protein n=1 Tax=Sphingomonas changnyeongensis TaxID=2698679 RepID=A0A7Z2S8X1_9SPHN|nr:hypothetical protein [Sphingomonas changnyeongensis]QHL91137.1 hypothetical protein GVO57_10305 [Sphingomonas changnyeongensis]